MRKARLKALMSISKPMEWIGMTIAWGWWNFKATLWAAFGAESMVVGRVVDIDTASRWFPGCDVEETHSYSDGCLYRITWSHE